MRIIAGKWGTRKIEWPEQGKTRPITDRVKEALFDALGSRFRTPGALPPITVADVFCGAGSLGLESLSRGAAHACFFERGREALRVLKRNLSSLGTGPEATIASTDIWRTGVRLPAGWAPFDLVFLDPPFADVRDMTPRSNLAKLLLRIAADDTTSPDSTIVLRHESRVKAPEHFAEVWKLQRRKEYGTNALSFLVRMDHVERQVEPSPENGIENGLVQGGE